MRKLSDSYKIPGRSLPEVYERFNQALLRHQGPAGVKFCGRKLSAEAMTNAIAIHFLDMDFAAQEFILTEYVPRFERMLSEEGTPANGPPVYSGKLPSPKAKRKPG